MQDCLWGPVTQSAIWVLLVVGRLLPLWIWCLGAVLSLPWIKPLCCPLGRRFLSTGRISWCQPLTFVHLYHGSHLFVGYPDTWSSPVYLLLCLLVTPHPQSRLHFLSLQPLGYTYPVQITFQSPGEMDQWVSASIIPLHIAWCYLLYVQETLYSWIYICIHTWAYEAEVYIAGTVHHVGIFHTWWQLVHLPCTCPLVLSHRVSDKYY